MVNDFKLSGRVVRDLETKHVGNGYVAYFSIAHNFGKDWKKVFFMPVEGWNDAGRDITDIGITKGTKVIVSGRFEMNKVEGQKGWYPVLKISGANDIEFPEKEVSEDDIPF